MDYATMEKTFNFSDVEKRTSDSWLRSGSFSVDCAAIDSGRSCYAIMMPPPNVTGVLHMGHLLNNTLQDILIRRASQRGEVAFWQSGTDHAGISMQVRVEKDLLSKGLDAKKMSREEFLRHAERWRDEHGDIILRQLRRLGVCCDLTRKVHTLDRDYSNCVLRGFVELYRRGHIYRGRRIVNWCPVSKTAISDEEVFTREVDGHLWRIRYELVDEPGKYIEVCTTRPETIGGDVAIAVNPNDLRYTDFLGKRCWRPFPREAIPIIADEAVDKSFGTGALKITPAHSAVDFEIGQRHNLPVRDAMNEDGTMNELAGKELAGIDRGAARVKSIEILRELGCLVSSEPHRSALGISERSGVPIEPRISEQWFLRYPHIDLAKRAVEEGHIRFFPRRWEKTYIHWLNNIHDWCLSRQLLWGHRIPVWYRIGADRQDPENWHVSIDGPADSENWERDGDVLDTWFSSAFWPLGTLGWPDDKLMETRKFSKFYPTHTLVTGPDIIFFWVARMVTMAVTFLGNDLKGKNLCEIVPFRNVYFTGIVRDNLGRKMSKSLGNSPDPIELLDRYGADSVRFGLVSSTPLGQDILFDEKNLELGRNFCTKLWNACRFRLMQGPPSDRCDFASSVAAAADGADVFDHQMASTLLAAFTTSRELLEGGGQGKSERRYLFQASLQTLEHFFRDDFCDFYVELCKWRLKELGNRKGQTLAMQDLILRTLLQLLAPFMPFITQELWNQLNFGTADEALHLVQLPDLGYALKANNLLATELELEQVAAFRMALTQLRAMTPSGFCGSLLFGQLPSSKPFEEKFRRPLLAMLGNIGVKNVEKIPENVAAVDTPWGRFALEANDGLSAESFAKIKDALALARRNIAANRAKLDDGTFLAKAPQNVVEGARRMLKENLELEAQLLGRLEGSGEVI
ncbi:MAG: valine--tRNA ligase [Puniceicoccales bacterium]|jgi:valyl-tRNA synthetase|nr:valine--tRNA ligase [Puniceicoccales bacterium]